MTKKQKIKKGFTLVETLVAISVLMISVTTAFGVSSTAFSSAGFSRDQLIASYLIEDALDFIRSEADTSVDMSEWDLRDGQCIGGGQLCTVDTAGLGGGNPFERCDSGICPYLKVNDDGVYNYSTGSVSKFKRWITIEKIEDYEIKITASVSWMSGSEEKTFSVIDELYKWR